MTVTPDILRADFPAFADITVYTDDQINYWLCIAGLQIPGDPNAWTTTPCPTVGRSMRDYGTELFVCHYLTVMQVAQDQAAAGNPPVGMSGIIQSKAVGPASVSYDTTSTIEQGAGFWNSTMWGRMLYHLAKLQGMGPVQLGIGYPPPFTLASSGAWPGPWPYPTFQSGFSS